ARRRSDRAERPARHTRPGPAGWPAGTVRSRRARVTSAWPCRRRSRRHPTRRPRARRAEEAPHDSCITRMTAKDNVLTDTPGRGTVEAVTAAVAEHMRALRQARGWSLDELSGRSGVSKGMVVQIEAARTNPSVGTLTRIADAFGVTVARLLEPAADRTVRVSVASDAPLLWRGGYGGFGRLLAGLNEPDFVELWEWRLSPQDRHESPDHAPGTR